MIIKQSNYEIKQSKFIGYLLNVDKYQDFAKSLTEIKVLHKKAKHFCYAYKIFDQTQLVKAYNDGEPHGSAGIPIFSLLERKNLNNTAIIVVRYFGGIKLGKGPLLRAYMKTASLLLAENIKDDNINKNN